jgi:hypothetical protein
MFSPATYHDHGVMQPQAFEDVGTNRRSCGGGQRDDPRAVQAVEKYAQTEVVRTEVMAPGRHAVRLVDGDQGRPHRIDGLPHLIVGQLLGSQKEELDSAGRRASQCLIPLLLGFGRAHSACHGPAAVLLQPAGLVLLQRQEGRDDQGRAIEEHRRQLIGQRLAAAGGLH